MFSEQFSVCFSCLDLLKARETGVVSHIDSDDEAKDKIAKMGIVPGLKITLEKRFPALVAKVGSNRLTLDREMARSIYVKLGDRY